MNEKKVTIAGVLVPDQWENDGQISGLALLSNDEKKYLLNYSTLDNDLMPMLRQEVEVHGLLDCNSKEATILVTCFRPVSLSKSIPSQ